ncbi:MAG: peptidylprolyl isomerase [Eubacteriaceae bacterium]|nr:peptidylprolyl isomerase [Eubacteriaceae bacterium]
MVTVKIKGLGDIKIELDKSAAPITAENFESLVGSGFYDGLTFHRVIKGFMIQGGDPRGDGTGGAKNRIKGEFSSNGVNNPLSHQRGVVSMARSQDPDSASCQFFIVHQTSPHLDGNYAAFGKIVEGMDVVDKIAETPTGRNDNPVEPVVIEKAYLE